MDEGEAANMDKEDAEAEGGGNRGPLFGTVSHRASNPG